MYCGSSETTCTWVLHIIMDIRVQYFTNVDFCLSLVNFGRCGVSDNGILRDPEQVPTWFNSIEDVREKAHTTRAMEGNVPRLATVTPTNLGATTMFSSLLPDGFVQVKRYCRMWMICMGRPLINRLILELAYILVD